MSYFDESPWQLMKLGSVCGGKENADPTRLPNQDFSYVDITSVSNETFSVTSPKRLVGRDAPSRARKRIRRGDVIVATTRPYLKSIAQVPDALDGEVCSTGFCVLRPIAQVTSDWLYYCALSNDFIGQLTACMRGATYPAVTDSDVMEAAIPVPPVSDQKRIVARIKECIERVDEIDKLRALSDAESRILLRSIYRDLYCDLKAKYDPIALRTVGRVTGGGTPSKQNAAFWTGDIPWVSPKDMKRRDIYSATDNISEIALSQSSAKLIETPSVLFVVRGMILAHTLPIAISRVPLAINQDMKAITPTDNFEVEFIAAMLRGAEPDLLHSVEVAGHGTRRLQTEHWQALPIPALPAKKQREVVSMVRGIEGEVDMLRDSCPTKEVGQLREAVLRRAFAGEL